MHNIELILLNIIIIIMKYWSIKYKYKYLTIHKDIHRENSSKKSIITKELKTELWYRNVVTTTNQILVGRLIAWRTKDLENFIIDCKWSFRRHKPVRYIPHLNLLLYGNLNWKLMGIGFLSLFDNLICIWYEHVFEVEKEIN